uniref:Uncharacterized protein n=1 Tax=Laticauda laticaudata TaxID=8630 RepID=A0A8C5S9Q4_LATLA
MGAGPVRDGIGRFSEGLKISATGSPEPAARLSHQAQFHTSLPTPVSHWAVPESRPKRDEAPRSSPEDGNACGYLAYFVQRVLPVSSGVLEVVVGREGPVDVSGDGAVLGRLLQSPEEGGGTELTGLEGTLEVL